MSEAISMHPLLGKEVAIGSIDRELRQLWEQDQASTNASLINLAVYSEAPGALERNSENIRELTREHACRAILIGIDRAAEEASIRAWITAHCHLAHGRKSVCCEQISFALTGRATGRLRNTVFAHLNSDLPLVLWWQGELSPLFTERFYSLLDRLIVDSSEWKDSAASFAVIEEAIQTSSKTMLLHDLEWTRTYCFRLAIAALFDDPLAQNALPQISDVKITYHPQHRNAALQILAWLATQAGWRAGMELDLAVERRDGNRQGFSFESKEGVAIRGVLIADEKSAALGSVVITAGDVEVSVQCERGAKHVQRRLKASCGTHDSLGPAEADDSADLVGDQLSRGGKNSLFLKILPKFRELLAQ